jgi:ferric-dicitrate binding protein FerR (iron transport regulator)
LLKGEAYFSVARDETAPVHRRGGWPPLSTAQAGFRVRKLDGILSTCWSIRASRCRGARTRPTVAGAVALTANTRLVLSDPTDGRSAAERPQPIAPEAVTRELAWREGKLAFEGETLKQAADTFARYSETRIQIPRRGPGARTGDRPVRRQRPRGLQPRHRAGLRRQASNRPATRRPDPRTPGRRSAIRSFCYR